MSAEHVHAAFEVPADPFGPRIDGELLGRFIGAGFDGCTGCRNALLPLLADDPATTVRLVEMACVAIHHAFAGLPLSVVDAQAPGAEAAAFRCLVHAGTDAAHAAMLGECERMTPDQRRAAATTAADLLIGQLT
jgi:hypothetical protein